MKSVRYGKKERVIWYLSTLMVSHAKNSIKKIDIAVKSDPEIELIMKKQVDGVYDHIPFVQNIEMRDYFQEGYAREIYKTCINRYVTEKP